MKVGLLLALIAVLLLLTPIQTTNPVCTLCHDIVKQFQHSVPRRPAESILSLIGTAYCTKKHLQNHNVCKGAVSEMIDSIINSLWRHFTDPHAVCHKLRFCPKEYQVRNLNDDIKSILKDKPAKEWEQPTGKKTIRVAHISDLHPDLFYTVGAVEKCSEPVCCRSNSTLKLDPKEIWRKLQNGQALYTDEQQTNAGAGYWGSLSKCDLPIQTFNLFLKEIQDKNVDFIIWTGDNTPHDVWQQTQTYNLNFTTLLSEKLKKGFKGRVIAAMGNHQSFPVNVYDYQGTRQQMLNGGLAEAWKDWLDQKAYDMLRTKGYFSISMPEFNNLKIISVNTQAQNNLNWFLLRNPTDPGDMLKWIESQLKESEKIGQFVYLIGHIPPKQALNDWSMRFNALVDRYAYIIRGQFYGHTHRDHIGFFPSMTNNSQLVNTYLIAPSLTTYSNKHPEYRIMSIDLDTLQVVDYEQYRLDLTKFKAKEDDAHFQVFYRFKEAYGLKDMTIKGGMSTFREKMEKDNETQIKYSYFRSSGTEKGTASRAIYCDTTTSPQFQAECSNSTFKPSAFEKAAGDWKDLIHAQ